MVTPTMYVIATVVGMAGSVAAIAMARKLDAERKLFGWALVIAAFWYIGFGLFNGQTIAELAPQFAAGAVFIGVAILGFQRSIAYIGIGWVLHIFWDYLGPLLGEVAAPWWTAPVCLGFDVIVGGYLLLRARNVAPIVAPESA